jgi:hypothetical protein
MSKIVGARYVVEWFDTHFGELTTMEVETLEYARQLRGKHSNALGKTIWLDDQGRELSQEPGLHEVR